MEQEWYKDGLRFKCTGCGKCCTGSPGYVWVTEDEIQKMAQFLNITVNEFAKKYLRKVQDRYSLVERRVGQDYECVFLKENKCTIYEARPIQCQTYPWWIQNLKSKSDWEEAARYCEGINEDADIIPLSKIREGLYRS